MLSIWDTKYLVIDVETTGAHAVNNRLIDIACVTNTGGELVSQFNSLIKPHQFIPPFIANMTGISNEMVYNAPECADVLIKLKDILVQPDSVFVAHNLQFDWGFVRASFERCEIEFPQIFRLCTLKLARRLLRKDIKKNVGSLAEYFGIKVTNRHRALGDALATAKILTELLEIAEDEHGATDLQDIIALQNKPIKNFVAPSATFKRLEQKLEQLPECPGVYYFSDSKEKILYVGKAKSLKERVSAYFQFGNVTSKKISQMLKKAYNLNWTTYESELEALINESREIKSHTPEFNTLDKVYRSYPFIKLTSYEKFPIIEITRKIEEDGAEYFGPFRSSYNVDNIINSIKKQFKVRLCNNEIELNSNKKPCFYYHIQRCDSPCSGKMSYDSYKTEIEKIRLYLSGYSDGIIKRLETTMNNLSEDLEFEKAAKIKSQITELRKLFERKQLVPTSINSNNFIMLLPSDAQDRIVQVFFIKGGKFEISYTIGRKAPIDEQTIMIKNLYFNDSKSNLSYDEKDINDIKIINSWIYKQRETSHFVYIQDKSKSEVIKEFSDTLRSIVFEDELNQPETEFFID
jgi:DNA polymerase III subunit epsilon